MASSSTSDNRRRGARRGGGSRCSHSAHLDVPLLDLGSNMSVQLAHERNGAFLTHATSSTHDQRSSILHALSCNSADLSKAQICGHCHQLTARLTESLLHHLLFAKGQLPEPISLLLKRKELASSRASPTARRGSQGDSSRARKEDKLLRKLAQLRESLQEAAQRLGVLHDNSGEGPSSRPYPTSATRTTSQNLRLVLVMGVSASMPREVFALDLIQAIGRCNRKDQDLQGLLDLTRLDGSEAAMTIDETDERLDQYHSEAFGHQRDAARNKTSSNWERKLVRLLVSDERLESFLGAPLAPTKTHVFLSAPASFHCPGWSARHHLDFNLDHLCQATATDQCDPAIGSSDTSMSSSISNSTGSDRKRASSSPLQGQHRTWNKSTRDSFSSVADSWPEDSASEHQWESSISSMSEDSRPPSSAERRWQVESKEAASEASDPACSSQHIAGSPSPSPDLHSIETSRTGSSLGSSTVYGHGTNDLSMDVAAHGDDDMRMSGQSSRDHSASKLSVASAGSPHDGIAMRRRSREPKAGGLLSRNLLKARQSRVSDTSSVRSTASSFKKAPRCAGLQIDFTDPEATIDATREESSIDHCWFQCEVVLEGFR